MSTTLGWVGSELRTLLVRVSVAARLRRDRAVALAAEMLDEPGSGGVARGGVLSVPPASASVPEGPRLLVPASAIAETASVAVEIVVPPVKGLAPRAWSCRCRPGRPSHCRRSRWRPSSASVRSKARVAPAAMLTAPPPRLPAVPPLPTLSVPAETVVAPV